MTEKEGEGDLIPPASLLRSATGRLAPQDKVRICLNKIFHSEGVPPFSSHAAELMVRALDPEAKCSELARIIVKDLGLTSNILRLANSAWYNRSGRPVMSVAHGIMLMGWDTVRHLVSTIPYVEHFANRSPGLRELMLMGVLSAEHSRKIAANVGYPNPEEAHLCGLFANLGEVLVACYYGREYSEIILKMHQEKIPARAACVQILDFTWEEVGLQVASGWNLPTRVLHCLGGKSSLSDTRLDCCLASITAYAHDLTHALYRDGLGLDSVALRCVLDPEGQKTLVPVRDLRTIIDSALLDTEKTFYALHIPTADLRLERQTAQALHILESIPAFDPVAVKDLDGVIDAAVRAISQDDFELSSLITGLIGALHATGFHRVVFGLMNEHHSAIRGRLASGEAGTLDRFHLPMSAANSALVSALESKQDAIVDRPSGTPYHSSALIAALAPKAFALLPIVIDQRVAGCLYADSLSTSPGLESRRSALGRVRNSIAAAIRHRARGSKR